MKPPAPDRLQNTYTNAVEEQTVLHFIIQGFITHISIISSSSKKAKQSTLTLSKRRTVAGHKMDALQH